MSVATLVKKEKAAQKRRLREYEKEQEEWKKKLDSKHFSQEIKRVINSFEHRLFNINDDDETVANIMVHHNGTRLLSWEDDTFSELQFSKDDEEGRQSVTRSGKFNKWKKSLEDKFKININIYRDYQYRDRYSNSGYATYPDRIYCGLKVQVTLKDS